MSDINSILRRLDLRQARKITEEEANTATPPLSKYFNQRGNIRKIEKIPYKFALDTLLYNFFDNPDKFLYHPRCLFKFDLTLPNDFYILKKDFYLQNFISVVTINAFMVVKFRWADVVYRYRIEGENGQTVIPVNPVYVPPKQVYIPVLNIPIYRNQKIGKNCVIEVWSEKYQNSLIPEMGLLTPSKWITSLLVNPTTGDETEILIEVSDPYEIEDRSLTLPFDMDSSFPNNEWLDNPDFNP